MAFPDKVPRFDNFFVDLIVSECALSLQLIKKARLNQSGLFIYPCFIRVDQRQILSL